MSIQALITVCDLGQNQPQKTLPFFACFSPVYVYVGLPVCLYLMHVTLESRRFQYCASPDSHPLHLRLQVHHLRQTHDVVRLRGCRMLDSTLRPFQGEWVAGSLPGWGATSNGSRGARDQSRGWRRGTHKERGAAGPPGPWLAITVLGGFGGLVSTTDASRWWGGDGGVLTF